MKRIFFRTLGSFLFVILAASIIVSCEKDSPSKSLQVFSLSIENINFDKYFSGIQKFEIEFWEACDQAYKSNSNMFLEVCNNNDFEQFKEITNLDADFFENFTNEVLDAQKKIETDYPGICDKYRESPCEECSQKALQRIGSYVSTNMGNSSAEVLTLDTRDCIFICSLGCMSTMELYIPCVLACTRLCSALSSLEK